MIRCDEGGIGKRDRSEAMAHLRQLESSAKGKVKPREHSRQRILVRPKEVVDVRGERSVERFQRLDVESVGFRY